MLPIFVINKKVLDASSMGADITSEVVDVAEVTGFAVHYIWTGTPVGDLITQASNDGINFVAINTQAAGGAAGQHMLNVENQHYRYLRLFYDSSSSTGSLTAYISGKRN